MDRPLYLEKLINKMNNGMIKVVTGIRRCGKSYLLFELFYKYLLDTGIPENHIIKLALDDRAYKKYRNPDELYKYIKEQVVDSDKYYILLDEVQYVSEFEDVLNSLLHIKNTDVYVTGSNAKFLSKDIVTEFRGRGDQVHLFPFSFSEFMNAYDGDKRDGWIEYITYGGMPKLLGIDDKSEKTNYLNLLFEETYLKDILDRNDVRNTEELEELLNIISSNIGCLVNPKKIADTFKSRKNKSIHPDTIKSYLEYFEDAFIISKAQRYDIKGRKYINTPQKYYYSDLGLRNARLNFRQIEESHLMENVIYNELIVRGYNVDVGVVVDTSNDGNGNRSQKQLEIDFVCNQGFKRIYIQSALELSTVEKIEQEKQSLLRTKDAFKKIIIVKDSPTHFTEDGIQILNLFDFLLDGIE